MGSDEVVGEVLREVRREKGLSQEKLALEAGMERNYISLIELGQNSPTVRMLLKLCAALELPASEFLARVEARLRQQPKKRASRK